MLLRESERLYAEAFRLAMTGQCKRATRLAAQARILDRRAKG